MNSNNHDNVVQHESKENQSTENSTSFRSKTFWLDGQKEYGTPLSQEELSSTQPTVDKMLESYNWMWRARYLSEYGTTLQRNGKLYLWVSSRGQEAAQTGVVLALDPRDYIFPSYREHLIPLYRGVSIKQLISRFASTDNAGWSPDEHNCNIYTLVLGSQLLHATGFAMADCRKPNTAQPPRAVVSFFGDGASTQGEVHEAMVFAASQKTPQLFVLQNNQWAISTPSSIQSPVPFYHRGYGYGMGSIEVDGNDFVAVYSATKTLLTRIRDGHGPQLLVANTYRVDPHATSDAPNRYRDAEVTKNWQQQNDPITRLEVVLETQKISSKKLASIREESEKWVKDSINELLNNEDTTG